MVAYLVSSTLAAALLGGILGWVGAQASLEVRLAVATLLGLAGALVGAVEVLGRRIKVPQCDVETPQAWVKESSWKWATKNGIALGMGAFSRIGFPLWYVIPMGSLLLASPAAGGAIYGSYGLFRAFPACAMYWIEYRYRFKVEPISTAVVRAHVQVRALTAAYLMLFALSVVLVVGM